LSSYLQIKTRITNSATQEDSFCVAVIVHNFTLQIIQCAIQLINMTSDFHIDIHVT